MQLVSLWVSDVARSSSTAVIAWNESSLPAKFLWVSVVTQSSSTARAASLQEFSPSFGCRSQSSLTAVTSRTSEASLKDFSGFSHRSVLLDNSLSLDRVQPLDFSRFQSSLSPSRQHSLEQRQDVSDRFQSSLGPSCWNECSQPEGLVLSLSPPP